MATETKLTNISGQNLVGQKTTADLFSQENKIFNLSAEGKGFYGDFTFLQNDVGVCAFTAAVPNKRMYKDFTVCRWMLGYKKEITKWLTLEPKFFNTYENMFTYRYYFLPDEFGPQTDIYASYEGDFNALIKPSPNFNISLGASFRSIYDWQETGNHPTTGAENFAVGMKTDEKMNSWSVYSQITYKPISKFQIIAGIRLEKNYGYTNIDYLNIGVDTATQFDPIDFKGEVKVPDGEFNFIPRLAVLYSFNANNQIKFLYGKAIKNPSITENYDIALKIESGIDISFLKPEEIQTFEINYTAAFSKFIANISYFRNSMENLFLRRTQSINGNWETFSANSGKINSTGVEVSTQIKPVKSIFLDISATWQQSEYPDYKNRDVHFSPQWLGYVKLSYDFPNFSANQKNKITFALTGNYVDEMFAKFDDNPAKNSPTKDPSDPNFIPVGRLGEKTPSYFLLGTNFRVNNLIFDRIFFNFRISNLLNQKIIYPTDDQNKWANKGTFGNSRYFQATLGYKF